MKDLTNIMSVIPERSKQSLVTTGFLRHEDLRDLVRNGLGALDGANQPCIRTTYCKYFIQRGQNLKRILIFCS